MRKRKIVKIDGLEITVKELSVEDILDLQGLNLADFESALAGFLPRCTDIGLGALKKLAPSEIRLLVDAFREVNADFFLTAGWLGLDGLLANLKAAILRDFSELLADSLKPATLVR